MRVPVAVAVVVACFVAGGRAQSSRPLPDKETFQREVRARLQVDDLRQRDYIYTATHRSLSVDGKGVVKDERIKVVESYPGLPGEDRWERLLVEGGRPVPSADLAKQDRDRQREAEAYVRKRARMTRAEQDGERRAREKEKREQADILDDAFRVFAFTMTGREYIDGHETVAVSMAPQRHVKTRTRQGGWAKHFKGRAWISESEHELVKLEVEAIDTLSVGLGMFARIHEGSKVAFERRRMDDGAWLPARASIAASARLLLLKRLRLNTITDYSNYRRFTVDTSTTYGLPAAD
jgi:hypothetical protein